MGKNMIPILTGRTLHEENGLTLAELSRACAVHAERILELIDEGILEPRGHDPHRWRFSGSNLRRARTAVRLQRDLDINLAGVALALDLLEEIDRLQRLLTRVKR
jgi:chaperone modulatory protein CbpM